MTISVEGASIRHLDRLYEIELECFKKEAFAKQQIARLLTDYNSISLVAKINDKIAGFIVATVDFERNVLGGHILTIDVSLSHRRKGIGLRLLQETEKLLREKGIRASHLEVREDNLAALKLYQKSGYRKVGRLKNYYGNANGIYLWKSLT
jgi:ribosomal-protein-alanine acetyltransferase